MSFIRTIGNFFAMMRKQRSTCTLSSCDDTTLPDWSSMASTNYENLPYQNSFWPQFMSFGPDQYSNPYQDVLYDYNAAGEMPSHNLYAENVLDDSQTITDESYLAFADSWNPSVDYPFPEQFTDESPYNLPIESGAQSYFGEPLHSQLLQYGSPTITDYGAVALLLRHLIRVDVTYHGAVSIYNFPATSVTTLNSAGDKCYIKHPNGLVYLEGNVVHIMTGNNRMAKISHRGITCSTFNNSLAYFVDESGTKTTTGKFIDLTQDVTMDVFYDGAWPNHGNIEEECYKMASESTCQNFPDGSEVWNLGRIRIKQDKWGEVIISQNNNDITISTSPTIRRVNVEKPTVSINIDCFQRNYLTVKKDNCLVTSAYCGLVVKNRSQKAGLDRNGKLVLF